MSEKLIDWRVREGGVRMADMPERLHPEKEMERLGPANVSDSTLLAVLLDGSSKANKVDVARGLLDTMSLRELSALEPEALASAPGMTEKQAGRLLAAAELGRRVREETEGSAPVARTPEDVARLVRAVIPEQDWMVETMFVVLLNARNKVMGRPRVVSKGILDGSLVHPREVFRGAVMAGAACLVLAHNHPSGDPTPSAEDIRVTKQIVEAGRIVDIKVLDHVVVCREGSVSLREEGLVSFGG